MTAPRYCRMCGDSVTDPQGAALGFCSGTCARRHRSAGPAPTRTAAEVDAEKSTKPRPDLIPPEALRLAGAAFAAGHAKHGTPGGRGTYRIAGTEQARVQTHVASMWRHLIAWMGGDEIDAESGVPHLGCALAQLAIVIDLVYDPPGGGEAGGAYPAVLAREEKILDVDPDLG